MKGYIRNIIIYFILPGLVFFVSCELLLRNVPNVYSYKGHYVDANADNIEVLILGGSNAYYNLNPVYLKEKSFNFANVLQSYNYDYALLKKYGPRLVNLKYILIPVSDASLAVRLENSFLSDRVCYYDIYYNLHFTDKISDHFLLLNDDLRFSLNKIIGYYIYKLPPHLCTELGYGAEYNYQNKKDLKESGITLAHTIKYWYRKTQIDDSTTLNIPIKDNLSILKSMINYAAKRNIKVILFTPPCYHTYIENIDSVKLNETINATRELANLYMNVTYVNYLRDSSFLENDFYDAAHLDEFGSQKLTQKIDSIIKNVETKERLKYGIH